MDMKEKLVEILRMPVFLHDLVDPVEAMADYLLDSGVIVLPCKVGDTIYRCGNHIKKVYEWDIERIKIYFDETVYIDNSDNAFTADDIGKTVFLSRTEAEAALAASGEEDEG